MCDFVDWTLSGVIMEQGAYADRTARGGPGTGGSMMLTIVGVGTCPGPGWRHELARAKEGVPDDPTLEVFEVNRTAPEAGGETDPSAVASVHWTGPVNPRAETAEIRRARSDGRGVIGDIRIVSG